MCGGGSSRAPTQKERSYSTPGQQVGAITTKAGVETTNASPANPPTLHSVHSVRMRATSTEPSSRCGERPAGKSTAIKPEGPSPVLRLHARGRCHDSRHVHLPSGLDEGVLRIPDI